MHGSTLECTDEQFPAFSVFFFFLVRMFALSTAVMHRAPARRVVVGAFLQSAKAMHVECGPCFRESLRPGLNKS